MIFLTQNNLSVACIAYGIKIPRLRQAGPKFISGPKEAEVLGGLNVNSTENNKLTTRRGSSGGGGRGGNM